MVYQFDLYDIDNNYSFERLECSEEEVPGYIDYFQKRGFTVYRVFRW